MNRGVSLPLIAALLSACAGPDVAVKKSYDFSRIRRVAVLDFAGPSGAAASDNMVQALLAAGADVVERQRLDSLLHESRLGASGLLAPATVKELGRTLGVDAVIAGSVTQASPAQSYLVFTEDKGRHRTESLGQSGTVIARGPAAGMPGTDVLTAAASAGMTARMIDVETGSILWTAHLTWEGIDLDAALARIADSFVESLKPIWLDKLR